MRSTFIDMGRSMMLVLAIGMIAKGVHFVEYSIAGLLCYYYTITGKGKRNV